MSRIAYCFGWVWVLAASAAAPAVSVQGIVDQVSQSAYVSSHELLYVHAGHNRGPSGAQHDLARTNIQNYFLSLNLATSLDPPGGGQSYRNVVAVQPGLARPQEIYIVGAHYDSVSNPGADDNASGVAAIMEAARVLSGYEFEATLIYIAFDLEETGHLGSIGYANAHRNDDIRGMISVDMIAYNDPSRPNRANIFGRSASNPLKQDLAAAIGLYGDGLTASVGGVWNGSDHASFEAVGKQACFLIEAAMSPYYRDNPHYHKATDSVDTPNYIDYPYATKMTRSVVGYLADAAVPIPEPASVMLLAASLALIAHRRRIAGRQQHGGGLHPSPCGARRTE